MSKKKVTRVILEDRDARLKLEQRKRPHYLQLLPGLCLGYRRNQSCGTWVAKIQNGVAAIKALGAADDAAGSGLTFAEAEVKARALRGDTAIDPTKIVCVGDAIQQWRMDLIARGGSPKNADDLLPHIAVLAKRPVKLLTAIELRNWRNGLRRRRGDGTLQSTSKTRISKSLRAALTLAAKLNSFENRDAWEIGLEALPNTSNKARNNSTLRTEQIGAIVSAAYRNSIEDGRMIETLAATGARFSQVQRLTVDDLRSDKLNMPGSLKGKKHRKCDHKPVQILPTLAMRLRVAAGNRAPADALLLKFGKRWTQSQVRRAMRAAVKCAGLDADLITPYWLRHSSMTRAIESGVSVQAVAKTHDTSVPMIEGHYCRYILENAETVAQIRKALVDFDSVETGGVVTPIKAA
jgi:site-specific recombinase XerD